MLNFVRSDKGLIAFYLAEAKHIICSVSSAGESDSQAVVDVIYPDAHLPGALLIAQKMRERNEMPTVLINRDTKTKLSLISVIFKLRVEGEFLFLLWPRIKEFADRLEGREIMLGMAAFSKIETPHMRPFIKKFYEGGLFRLDIGMPFLKESMKERLLSTDLRCYKNGIPDLEHIKVVH